MSNFEQTNHQSDTAVIPKGTTITGNVDITGKLEMYGEIQGDINSDSQVNICGYVTGNIQANDLYTKDSVIEGQIVCTQEAVVNENTVVLGDIYAKNLVVEGAVQGNLDIKELITIGKSAVIDSDIKTKFIQVSNGAVMNGNCSLCYADVNAKEFFDTAKKTDTMQEYQEADIQE